MKGIVIEDDPEVVEFILLSLQIGWPEFELQHTDNGKKGLELIKEDNIDIVLLDLGLPDISGFELLKTIRLFSNVPIIIITVYSEEADIVKGLQLGADDYLVKPFKQLELMARIKAILRRQHQNLENEGLVLGQWHIEASRNRLCSNDDEVRLTPSETRLLMHLLRNAGKIVTLGSIADEMWGTEYPGSHHAIRVYIQRLRRKIESGMAKPPLIITKPGIGYCINKPTA